MPSLDTWAAQLAAVLRPEAELLAVYVAQGEGLTPLRLAGRRPARPLDPRSALVPTLRDLRGPLLLADPSSPVASAALQELAADAALLVQARGQLVAVACIGRGDGDPDAFAARLDEISADAVARCPRSARLEPSALAHPSWIRRLGARLFGPGPA